MRKKFLWFVLVPVVILLLVLYLFLDRWVERGLEAAGEEVVGARVEIDNLALSLSPIGIRFARIQVANPKDPWKNILETGTVAFALDFGQLLRNKYIIETMEVNDLLVGTKRTTDGSLPPRLQEESSSPGVLRQAADAVIGRVEQAPLFDLEALRRSLNIDSLIALSSLKSLEHVDSLKVRVQDAAREWETTLAEIEQSKQRLTEMEAAAKSININELKSIEAITGAINNLNTVSTTINELNRTFTDRRSSITNQLNAISASVSTIDDLAKEDYARVRSLARLPDLSTQGLATLLLGKTLLEEIDYYLGWMEYARTTIQAYTPAPQYEKPKRFEGQDIYFPVERSYPKLWIKNIRISGGTDPKQDTAAVSVTGEVKNITDNQRLTGLPLSVALSGRKGASFDGQFKALFDRRGELPVDDYAASISGIPIGSFSLGRSDFLPATITRSAASLDVAVHIPGNRFDSNMKMVFGGTVVQFERAPKNDLERIARQVLEGIRGFTASVRLWNTGGPFNLAFSTDLDDQLASRARQVIGDELARIQWEIMNTVDRKIAEYRVELDRLFRQKKEEALTRIAVYERLLNEKLAVVEGKKKELEARIEEEKKKQSDAAKKKLDDAVKGLFKKQ